MATTTKALTGASTLSSSHKLRQILQFALAAMIILHILFYFPAMRITFHGGHDHWAFYGAGRVVRSGEGRTLYHTETQKRAQEGSLPLPRPTVLFIHPAVEALLFVPLTWLYYPYEYVAWCVINVLIVLALPCILLPHLPSFQSVLGRGSLVLSFLAFLPVIHCIAGGQDSLPLLLVYTLVFAALKSGRDFKAGILLGLGLFRFQLIIPVVLAFLICKKWAACRGFLITAMAMVSASVAITGWQGALDYVRMLMAFSQISGTKAGGPRYWVDPALMANLRGFLQTQFWGKLPEFFLTYGVLVLSLSLVVWGLTTWWRLRAHERNILDLLFAWLLTLAILGSFHLYIQDLTLLLLPLLLVTNHLAAMKRPLFAAQRLLTGLVLVLFLDVGYIWALSTNHLYLMALPILAFAGVMSVEVARAARVASFPQAERETPA